MKEVLLLVGITYVVASLLLTCVVRYSDRDNAKTKGLPQKTESFNKTFIIIFRELWWQLPKCITTVMVRDVREMVYGADKSVPSRLLSENRPGLCTCKSGPCGQIHFHSVLCGLCRNKLFKFQCRGCDDGFIFQCCCGSRVQKQPRMEGVKSVPH